MSNAITYCIFKREKEFYGKKIMFENDEILYSINDLSVIHDMY